ncbi:TPA: hypothetical protein HA246_01390 [Candidatus Woesearchaeota archaeon]|nr:hypothetical protein [Candidatus Woesearchaeota archaeon]
MKPLKTSLGTTGLFLLLAAYASNSGISPINLLPSLPTANAQEAGTPGPNEKDGEQGDRQNRDNTPSDAPKPEPRKYEAVISAVEREVRKYDNWIVGQIRQDYTQKDAPGRVKLWGVAKKVLDGGSSSLIPSALPYYDATYQFLALPHAATEQELADVIPSIDHELVRVFLDKKRGLLGQEGYAGPTNTEIADYCSARTAGEEFTGLRASLDLWNTNHLQIFSANSFIRGYALKLYDAKSKLDSITGARVSLSSADEYLDDKAGLDAEQQKLEARVDSMREVMVRHISAFRTWRENAERAYFNGTLDAALAEEISTLLTNASADAQSYEDIGQGLVAFAASIQTAYSAAHNTYVDAEVAKIRQSLPEGASEEDKEMIEQIIEIVERKRKMGVDSLNRSVALSNAPMKSAYGLIAVTNLGGLLAGTNSDDLGRRVNDPYEVFINMVDSLYNLHYGAPTQNRLPLTEEDLWFLERFTLDGKQAFEKGIQKYKLGLKLLQDGWTPKRVQSELRDATVIELDGRTYYWTQPEFSVRGDL